VIDRNRGSWRIRELDEVFVNRARGVMAQEDADEREGMLLGGILGME
jgi:hypothetical protein